MNYTTEDLETFEKIEQAIITKPSLIKTLRELVNLSLSAMEDRNSLSRHKELCKEIAGDVSDQGEDVDKLSKWISDNWKWLSSIIY